MRYCEVLGRKLVSIQRLRPHLLQFSAFGDKKMKQIITKGATQNISTLMLMLFFMLLFRPVLGNYGLFFFGGIGLGVFVGYYQGQQSIKQLNSKGGFWKCVCGESHKGFPYKCPNKITSTTNKVITGQAKDIKDFGKFKQI